MQNLFRPFGQYNRKAFRKTILVSLISTLSVGILW